MIVHDTRPVDPALRVCSRCGFRVVATSARLTELFEDHSATCPTRPSSGLRRKLKAAVHDARLFAGGYRGNQEAAEEAARRAASRVLAEAD